MSSSVIWRWSSYRKFFQELHIEPLHLGLIVLLLFALLTLLLIIVFLCWCPMLSKRRGKQLPAGRVSTDDQINCTNERRRLLLPSDSFHIQKFKNGNGLQNSEENIGICREKEYNSEMAKNSDGPRVSKKQKHNIIYLTAPTKQLCASLTEQSPPPPRRFFTAGGRTQVLPLTGGNRRRIPALMLLMTDQERKQIVEGRNNSSKTIETPESRTTTTGGKSCETIPEDSECDLSEELISIDRTLILSTLNPHQANYQLSQYDRRRQSLRLNSPFLKAVPKFEMQPPCYSPPEPPSAEQSTCRMVNNQKEDSTTRSNLSSPEKSSYGGETPLNTNTQSLSGESEIACKEDANYHMLISELECSDVGCISAVQPKDRWTPNSGSASANVAQLPQRTSQLPIVPRSISQQLEFMELTQQQ